MKLGVIVKADISNAAYRAITPMLALGECGHEVVLARLAAGGKFALRDLLTCDVVHVYRCCDEPSVVKGVDELRRRGRASVTAPSGDRAP
jgi:hypothetical protein